MSRTGWRSWAERIDLSSRPGGVDRLIVYTAGFFRATVPDRRVTERTERHVRRPNWIRV